MLRAYPVPTRTLVVPVREMGAPRGYDVEPRQSPDMVKFVVVSGLLA